ncbi:MAG: hypothetical protein K2N01_12720 [Lachnospiraceae bacterium]|nr:hypothetical protein [Lachnospiraceae bacterium]
MDSLFGTDNMNTEEPEKVVSMDEAKKKIKPFHIWTVAGEDHKMKLTTSQIIELEGKYRTNIMNMVIVDTVPALSIMLTIAKAAISPWEHGMTDIKIKKVYDKWMEADGGNQQKLYSDVIIPTMAVSGFFTEEQANALLERIQDAKEML